MDRLAYAVESRLALGEEGWPTLLPLAASVRQCFERERIALPTDFFRYETYLFVQTRRYAEAEAAFAEFFAGPAHDAPPDLLTRMYRRRGFLLARLGRTAASLEAYVQAGALSDQLPPAAASEVLLDVGERFRLLHDLPTAEQYFDEAERRLATLPTAEGAPTLGHARMLRAWAVLEAEERGELSASEAASRALPLAREAVRLLPVLPEPLSRQRRALALIKLAAAYRLAGHPIRAISANAEALRLAEELRATYPLLVSQVWSEQGEIALALGRPSEARAAFERALAVCREAVEPLDASLALLDLGELDEASPRPDFRSAERRYREAVALSESVRGSLGTQEWSASAFEDLQRPYRALARVLLRQGRAADAFVVLDGTRARYLRDLRDLTRIQSTLSIRQRTRLDSLDAAKQAVRRALARPDLEAAQRSALAGRVVALQREVERASGFRPSRPAPLRLGDLQNALRTRDQVLLTYFLDGGEAWAFVVDPDTFAAVQLRTNEAALRQALAEAGTLWRPEDELSLDVDLGALRRLHDALFAPVRPLMPAGARLVVVPEGVLTQLPFALLVERDHPRYRYADAPFLLHRHAISTELAAALLVEPSRPRLGGEALVLGRTRFSGVGASGERGADLPDLPNVEAELEQVEARLPGGHFALDERATEAFLDRHLPDVRLLHLASHAVANPALPLYSHIALWDDPAADDDGTLYLYELQGRRLDAELVVLSGCGTARGRTHVGEGMLGLQHAFRAAGAHATLATLWNVDDRATAALMNRFYAHLRRGLPKDRALQQAQLDYLDSHGGRAASPFFWAAPALYGDPTPLAWTMPLATQARWVLLGLALVLAAIALPRVQAWRRRSAREG